MTKLKLTSLLFLLPLLLFSQIHEIDAGIYRVIYDEDLESLIHFICFIFYWFEVNNDSGHFSQDFLSVHNQFCHLCGRLEALQRSLQTLSENLCSFLLPRQKATKKRVSSKDIQHASATH